MIHKRSSHISAAPRLVVFAPQKWVTVKPSHNDDPSILNVHPTTDLRHVALNDDSNQISSLSLSSFPLSPLLETPRTLRRKQRMMVLRRKSSRSLRSYVSIPDIRRLEGCNSRADRKASAIFTTSTSDQQHRSPTPTARLGHPNRPYYTAIRENMSPTTFTFPSTTPSPTRSSFSHPASQRRPVSNLSPADIVRVRADHGGEGRMSVPAAFEAGFSLSREVELRMALARERSRESPGLTQEFKFYETKKNPTVKGAVKKIGKGLMGFCFGDPELRGTVRCDAGRDF
ncbi:hypothetical protein EW146_g1870 [Bondarzewia mesenterica]|uniref:Uncharacterized protein n=1 Tax=Bondarzewia mesenterica TaxID=1095465 RepID=A0A4S4M3X5_9AGAM|nr:hypothetical protein EW146_g1870 [Bondarzewia mesenterica]